MAGIEEPIRAWALMKYQDVYGALRDHDTFASGRNPLAGKIAPKLALIQDDPPRHTRFRRLVNRTFTQKRIDELTPWIQAVTNELLDEMGSGETDVIPSFAIPLPVKVIARLLGIPGEDYFTLKRWSDAFLAFSSMAPEDRAMSNKEMASYFGRMAVARRQHGAEDLITALVEAEVEGESLDDAEILGFCMLLLIAGNETTTNLLGNMLGILADRPTLWSQLREDRSLVEAVIDETLRFESPIQRLPRNTTKDTEISGVKLPAGSTISVYYGAANRDPLEFSNPDEFRLDRDLHNHVAFGAGIHYCLGAPLARAEASIALNTLLDRFSRLERGAAQAVRQSTSLVVFGYQQLPLTFSTAK
ncbi:MAG: cytochrome P450 [Nitrospira sp.]|nr:cytochrome P450 [Nitrospira sp.]